jgi:hypothetical protein
MKQSKIIDTMETYQRLPSLSLPRGSSSLLPNLLGSLLVQKKLIQRFFSVWTLFDIDFLKSQKQAKKQQLALGTRLMG